MIYFLIELAFARCTCGVSSKSERKSCSLYWEPQEKEETREKEEKEKKGEDATMQEGAEDGTKGMKGNLRPDRRVRKVQ